MIGFAGSLIAKIDKHGRAVIMNADGFDDHIDQIVCLSGPCGPHNPNTFAAAPELLEELDCRVGDLVMLRNAIEAGDPKRELFVRIDDMLRESRAAIAKATAVFS
jgi:hypothetical protein